MKDRPVVALFATCLVDAMRPSVGFAALRVLEMAGCDVRVPLEQTCCGQPAFNSGARDAAADHARHTIALLEGHDYVVVPSGSCGGMIRVHYPELLHDDEEWEHRARALAQRTWEILSFLDDIMGWRPQDVALATTATYHDSCSGLRELGIQAQPRRLLSEIEGLKMVPMTGADRCCGFGGTFCVKYPAISNAITSEKARDIRDTGASLLLSGDLGCLMNMAGKLRRHGAQVRAMHAVEVLAGMGDGPAIGEAG